LKRCGELHAARNTHFRRWQALPANQLELPAVTAGDIRESYLDLNLN
jgi:hypothetical protein